jgi:hypothetical protein
LDAKGVHIYKLLITYYPLQLQQIVGHIVISQDFLLAIFCKQHATASRQ